MMLAHIHCLGIYDTETNQTLAYNDEGEYRADHPWLTAS
jgi:hypothetical protein